MLISVIMNVRNGAETLREAIDSVLQQTFTDFELLIWDDCSTDDSAKIVAEYSDPRIRYVLSPEDTRLGRARELAVRESSGDWLAFVDQDDIWLPEKLEKQVAVIESDDADGRLGIVYGRTLSFSKHWERDFDVFHEFTPLPEGDVFLGLFQYSCFINMSSAVLRRTAYFEIGGIPEDFQIACDYYLFVAIARSYRVRAVQDVVCRYRVMSSSLSHRAWHPMHEEALSVLDRWTAQVDPKIMEYRRRWHYTMIGVADIVNGRILSGLKWICSKGSVPYVLSRPFVRARRLLRRKFEGPYWRHHQSTSTAHRLHTTATSNAGVPKLSIIVVNWNVRDLLRDCLQSVYRQIQLPRNDWELIVVDNNSSDGSAEMLQNEFPYATLVLNSENLGFAKANNQAFTKARGRYVLLLNPDTVLEDDSIQRMLEQMDAEPKLSVLGSRLLNPDGTAQPWTAGALPDLWNSTCYLLFLYRLLPNWLLPSPIFPDHEASDAARVGWISGCCMLLRRQALSSRLFDDRFFMYGEDMELCDRLARAGWQIAYTRQAHVIHYGGRSMESQSREVQLTRHRSMREIFVIRNGRGALWWFDFVASVGFFTRSVAYALAARMRPGQGFEVRAARSRVLMEDAVRTLIHQ